MRRNVLGLAGFALLAAVAALDASFAAASPSVPLLSIWLKPAPADQNQQAHVDVTMRAQAVASTAGVPVLTIPFVVDNVETIAKSLENFSLTDARGAVPFTLQDDKEETADAARHWIASRTIAGALIVRYRAPIDNTPSTRGAGPPFELRTESGGLSGAGNTFLILPPGSRPYRLSLHWDLSALGGRAVGMSSFGDGDIEAVAAGPADRLSSAFFMAGPLHRYPARHAAGGFASAWLGSPPFAAPQLMAWTEKLNGWYTQFFKGDPGRLYRVFLRFNPVNAGGGVELTDSFVATFNHTTTAESMQLLLAHEMFHTWGPVLAPAGLSTSWFTEGSADFYARVLTLRAGMLSPKKFLDDLNRSAGRYYTNQLNTTPNAEIPMRFWEDTRIRVLPYDRGSLYMATVNTAVRKASAGARSLDDLLFELLERREHGRAVDSAAWVEAVTRVLGPAGRSAYEAMLAGTVIVPDSDAFGPCFERTTAPLRRYELGFDPKSLVQRPRIIRDLIPGSEAERAGIRNGDELMVSVPQDAIQGDQKRTLTLQLRRTGKELSVTYLPRGATVDAYQWRRIESTSDNKCGL